MSQAGRDVVHHLAMGEDAIERLGGLLPDEQVRILDGDHRSLVRRLEPAFDVGQELVLATARPRRTVITRPRFQGDVRPEVLGLTDPKPVPVVLIAITEKTRRRRGGWTVRFDVVDRRTTERLIRRQPPVYDPELMQRDQDRELTVTEIEEAREESFYGTNPSGAVDHLAAVDDDTLKQFSAEASSSGGQTAVAQQLRRERWSLGKRLEAARAEADRRKVNISPQVRVIERQLTAIEKQLYGRKAA